MKTRKCSTLSQMRLQFCFGNGSTCLTDHDPILPLQGRLLPSDLFCSWPYPSGQTGCVLGFVPAGSALKSITLTHVVWQDKNITYWCCWTQYACSMHTDLSQRKASFTGAARFDTRVVCTQTHSRQEQHLLHTFLQVQEFFWMCQSSCQFWCHCVPLSYGGSQTV